MSGFASNALASSLHAMPFFSAVLMSVLRAIGFITFSYNNSFEIAASTNLLNTSSPAQSGLSLDSARAVTTREVDDEDEGVSDRANDDDDDDDDDDDGLGERILLRVVIDADVMNAMTKFRARRTGPRTDVDD